MADENKYQEPTSAPAVPRALVRELSHDAAKALAKKVSDQQPVVHDSAANSPKKAPAAAIEKAENTAADLMPVVSDASSEDIETKKASPIGELDDAHQDETLTEGLLADDKTDAAVDDIMRRESDRLLATEDASNGGAAPVEPPHFRHHFLKRWLHSSLARWATFIVILAIAGSVGALPRARYWVLNHCGVRASLSVTIADGGTLLPLQNVGVVMDGQRATTNVHGVAVLHHLHLGTAQLSFSRVAFAPQTHTVIVGWGKNPLGSFRLQPTGVRYTIKAIDSFSGLPVASATAATGGDPEAAADKTGVIVLTLNMDGSATATATVNASGYRAANTTLQPGITNLVSLVPSQKDIFVAKNSGKYNVYKADADGSNTQLLLAGTGLETSKIALQTSPDGTHAALVSVRDSTTSPDGAAQQTLTLIDVSTGATTTLDRSPAIALLGWSGNTLVYKMTAPATNTPNPTRIKVISYNYATSTRLQLAAANDFNALAVAQNTLYYAASSSDPTIAANVSQVGFDGSSPKTLLNQEVIGIYRTDYNTLALQTATGWYADTLGDTAAPQSIPAPASYLNNTFALSPDGTQAAFITVINGAPTLQVYTVATGKTVTITTHVAASYPLHWLNNTVVVFRSGAGASATDYAVSILGGAAKKIAAVVNTTGFSN